MKSRELKKRENKWCYIVIFSSLASLFHSLSFHQLVSCFSPSHDTHPFSVYRLRMRHRDIPRGSNTDKTVVFVVKKKSEKRKWPALYFFFFFFNIAPPTFFFISPFRDFFFASNRRRQPLTKKPQALIPVELLSSLQRRGQ